LRKTRVNVIPDSEYGIILTFIRFHNTGQPHVINQKHHLT